MTGVAGVWNTGFSYLQSIYSSCYVAIIDDDDFWEPNHLFECERMSASGTADVVLSGIRVSRSGEVVGVNIPVSITVDDFLIGNPGWQGSNTFIRLDKALEVGGFTNGMVSCNDRDFTIRVLDTSPNITFTEKATVTWNICHRPDALSAPR